MALKRERWIPGAVIALAALSAGCAPAVWTGVTDGSPTATFTFHKGYANQHFASGAVSYAAATAETCADARPVANLSSLTSNTRAVALAAGRPLILQASSTYLFSGDSMISGGSYVAPMTNWTCVASATLIPEAGHSYDVKHVSAFMGICTLSVTDTTPGAPPTPVRIDDNVACPPPARAPEAGTAPA